MNLRLLSANDNLAALAAIHAASFTDAWNEQALADLLATPGAFVLAAEEGFILARVAGDEAEILTLAVRPSARRRGTANLLVAAAASHAQQRGAQVVFLEVGVANGAAMALYRHLGFVDAGRRKGYYPRPGALPEDALVLRSNLPLSPLGKRPAAG
jgi:ribosomal-protein-alanine N-acetyltransferase